MGRPVPTTAAALVTAAASTTSPIAAEVAAGARDLPSAIYDPSVTDTAAEASAAPV